MAVRGRATRADIFRLFSSPAYTDEDRRYLDYHADRIAFAINLIAGTLERIQAGRPGPARVLDVGPHFLTGALRAWFGSSITLATLGWANERLAPASIVDRHYPFDLNDAGDPARWPPAEPYDVIVMAEVIEHLHTSPRVVLAFLMRFLADHGCLLLQTPNAVSLHHRLKMVLGQNPFEKIRETRHNPGHFREYTAPELVQYCREVGLAPDRIMYVDYWPTHWFLKPAQWIIPRLRSGLTLLARKSAATLTTEPAAPLPPRE